MQIQLGDSAFVIEELEIALRYAAADIPDADLRAALLIAATALAAVTAVNEEGVA